MSLPPPMEIYQNIPDSPHQTIYEEFILLRRCFFPRVPHFGITSFHQPPLQIDWMANV